MDYLVIKYIHIVSSTILFGTGIGSAYYMYMANRAKELPGIAFATRYVVLADTFFTSPAVVIQLITGIALVNMGGYHFSELWILAAIGLYLFAGVCWLPVVWLQIKMRNMVNTSLHNNDNLPVRYWKYARRWTVLGSMAFPAILVVFYLMVFKPIWM